MPQTNEKPLITFALFAYNQERFIRKAIEGAFSQTYSPLEIILSDDCSSDRTFEIIQEMAIAYKGPHKIILNRNEKNLGIGGHVNWIMEISKGELIVGAAGDDISLPERTQKIYEAWETSERTAMSIYSAAITIDDRGNNIGIHEYPLEYKGETIEEKIKNYFDGVQGCSHAWDRKIFTAFGPILPETICEDRVLPFRSFLLGKIVYLSEKLVLYRKYGESISGLRASADDSEIINQTLNIYRRNLTILKNYAKDMEHELTKNKTANRYKKIKALLDKKIRLWEYKICFLSGSRLEKIHIIADAMFRCLDWRQIIRWLFILIFPSAYINSQRKNFVK